MERGRAETFSSPLIISDFKRITYVIKNSKKQANKTEGHFFLSYFQDNLFK